MRFTLAGVLVIAFAATATAVAGRRRRLTLKTDTTLANWAYRDRIIGTSIATATPTGHRRRNRSMAEASTPILASTPKTTGAGPGIHPAPCAPTDETSRSMPPAADSSTHARSVIRSSRALGVRSAIIPQRRREPPPRTPSARLRRSRRK